VSKLHGREIVKGREGVVHVKIAKCHATTPLELVHLDLCGIIHLASKLSIMIPSMVFIKLFNFIHKRFQPFHMAILLERKVSRIVCIQEFLCQGGIFVYSFKVVCSMQ
jgi:hypothetical protein